MLKKKFFLIKKKAEATTYFSGSEQWQRSLWTSLEMAQ